MPIDKQKAKVGEDRKGTLETQELSRSCRPVELCPKQLKKRPGVAMPNKQLEKKKLDRTWGEGTRGKPSVRQEKWWRTKNASIYGKGGLTGMSGTGRLAEGNQSSSPGAGTLQ